MKAEAGIVRNINIGSNKDAERVTVLLDCEITSPEDIQTVEFFGPAGDGSVPVVGSKVIILGIGSAWKIAIACQDGQEPEAEEGEKLLYSLVNGKKKTKIHLKKSGNISIVSLSDAGLELSSIELNPEGSIILNGGEDFGVRFSALLEAFEQLKSEIGLHIHDGVSVGSEQTSVPTAPFVASLLPAKIESLKVP